MALESNHKNEPNASSFGGEEKLSNRHPEKRYQFGCTCQEPQTIHLSLDGSDSDKTNRNAFVQNLRTHGWSPVHVSNAPNPTPIREEILALFRRRHIRGTNGNVNDVNYIPAESGSSKGTVEPKESLEVRLSNCSHSNCKLPQSHEKDDETVKNWCSTLSWVAHRICDLVLDLPPNTFLADDPNESLDLLRVFHYYAVGAVSEDDPSSSSSSPSTFGSSEHTDWGSLTVVWQDSIGGLQTYCRACQKWMGVRVEREAEPDTTASNRWQCVVHVGDMASLALDRSGDTPDWETTDNHVSFPWPSPKHRVVSPVHKERASLVYFGYPPRGLSMQGIQTILDNGWEHCSTRGRRLPLEEYFLLRNQSAAKADTTDDHLDSAEDESESSRLYQTMWNLPIQDIVRLKWEQVRREETS